MYLNLNIIIKHENMNYSNTFVKKIIYLNIIYL